MTGLENVHCLHLYLTVVCFQLCADVGLFSASVDDRGVGALDDVSLSEQTFPLQDGAGLRYSTLISGESNRDGKKHKVVVVDGGGSDTTSCFPLQSLFYLCQKP